jgi:hypothetical protein
MAGQEYRVAGLRIHDIGGSGSGDGWQFDIQGLQFFVDGHAVLLCAVAAYPDHPVDAGQGNALKNKK